MADKLMLDILLNPTVSGSKEGALLKSIISGKPISAAMGTGGGVKGTIQREFGEAGILKQIIAQEKAAAAMAIKIAKDDEKLEKKNEKESQNLTKTSIGILAGIGITLTQVPSILRGSLKMLSFGFLLILKPLADLLAMIILPIAASLLKIALWMNNIAGGGIGSMIAMAVIGLLAAIAVGIGTLMIGSMATTLITTAIEGMIISAIEASAISVLSIVIGGVLLGTIAALIVEALVIKPILVPLAKWLQDQLKKLLGIGDAPTYANDPYLDPNKYGTQGVESYALETDFDPFKVDPNNMPVLIDQPKENGNNIRGSTGSNNNNTSSVTINVQAPVYGVDNLERVMQTSWQKFMNQTNNTRQGMY